MHMPYFIQLFLFIITTTSLVLSNNTYAWNYQGHKLISNIAYNNLSKEQQKKLDDILDSLIQNLDSTDKKIYKKQEYNLSKLAKLSILPDYWKNQTLTSLAESNNILSKLTIGKNIGNIKTRDWHYSSFLIMNKSNIQENNQKLASGQLIPIFSNLITDIKNTTDTKQKALAIIFLTHLLEDAHQPMHAMSRGLDANNNNDRGGNLFCLRLNKKLNNNPNKYNYSNCKVNLHSYWDSAGNILKNNKCIFFLEKEILENYPRKQFNQKTEILKPENWIQESYSYWPIIYNLKENELPNKIYQAKTRAIASERIALASYRLTSLLKNLLD